MNTEEHIEEIAHRSIEISKPAQEIATQEQPAQVGEVAAIVSMIERAAMNPAVDIDKMERLLQMQERVFERQAQVEFNAAFARMQPELPAVERLGKSNTGDYGRWEDIQAAIQPVIARHGFGLSFKTNVTSDTITVTAILRHAGGHDDSTELALPADKSGSKNAVQAVGSSVSYGKRYTACALLNIQVGGEDNDGAGEPVSPEQLKKILTLLEDTNSDVEKFCKWAKIDAVKFLPAARFNETVGMLHQKEQKAVSA